MKFICIRECIWHHPDFDTPRHLVPDGGKTVYELAPDAPEHLFRPLSPQVADSRPADDQSSAAADLKDGTKEAEFALIVESHMEPEPVDTDPLPEQIPAPEGVESAEKPAPKPRARKKTGA
jgi:hypothetical protein